MGQHSHTGIMADSDDGKASSIPAWQRDAESKNATTDDPQPAQDHLETARRFLEDENVKDQSRDKKVAFLKGKGIEDGDIEKLLGVAEAESTDEAQPPTSSKTLAPSTTPTSATLDSVNDRAPIITYPEFLTSQTEDAKAPLITTLQITSFLSAVLVGTSKFLLTPMLERLTSARVELHDDVHTRLDKLLGALEKGVSVVPEVKSKKLQMEEEDEDPTECFHIDAATQTTSYLPTSSSDMPEAPPSEVQATRLAGITKSLGDIRDGLTSQTEDLGDIKMLVDMFRDDLDALTYKVA